jgi:hypothetical protein
MPDDFQLSREQLLAEIAEKTLDLQAFREAREILRRRVLEVRDSTSPLTPLPHWSGTDCVLGGLDLSIHAMERTLAELEVLLSRAPAARFTIIDGGSP